MLLSFWDAGEGCVVGEHAIVSFSAGCSGGIEGLQSQLPRSAPESVWAHAAALPPWRLWRTCRPLDAYMAPAACACLADEEYVILEEDCEASLCEPSAARISEVCALQVGPRGLLRGPLVAGKRNRFDEGCFIGPLPKKCSRHGVGDWIWRSGLWFGSGSRPLDDDVGFRLHLLDQGAANSAFLRTSTSAAVSI